MFNEQGKRSLAVWIFTDNILFGCLIISRRDLVNVYLYTNLFNNFFVLKAFKRCFCNFEQFTDLYN